MDMVLIGNVGSLVSIDKRLSLGPSLIPCRVVSRDDGRVDLVSLDPEQNILVGGATLSFLSNLIEKGLLRHRLPFSDDVMFS